MPRAFRPTFEMLPLSTEPSMSSPSTSSAPWRWGRPGPPWCSQQELQKLLFYVIPPIYVIPPEDRRKEIPPMTGESSATVSKWHVAGTLCLSLGTFPQPPCSCLFNRAAGLHSLELTEGQRLDPILDGASQQLQWQIHPKVFQLCQTLSEMCRLGPKIYKEHLEINSKTNNPIRQWAKDLNIHVTNYIWNANKPMKTYPTSLASQ